MPIFMQSLGVVIDMRDYAIIFTALDINNDSTLSLNEFGMFLEGAKLDQIQRIREIDPKLLEDMNNEVRELFRTFDSNKDGFITADEIKLAMLTIGRNITMEEAQNIIRTVDSNGDGRLDQREFCELML
jgi:Ca2+-binding EF-hand superfamily protein